MAEAITSPETVVSFEANQTSTSPVENGSLRRWRWTSAQYEQLAELGFFEGRRVELIDGEVIEMAAMGDRHWLALALVPEALRSVFSSGYFLNVQAPIRISEQHEPEPDVAVFTGNARDYAGRIPDSAVLVVEISLSTLDFDRGNKANLYASANIAEYWILNLQENQLEVYRRPEAWPEVPFGWRYRNRSLYRSTDTVSPLAVPNASIHVGDLLP